MRAVIAPHITDLTRYTGNGLEHQRSDEATISIIGQLEDLRQIDQIAYAGYQIALDHVRQRARHRHHHDPAIPFELKDDHVLQIFLYGLKPNPRVLDIDLRMRDGRHRSLKGELQAPQSDTFTSRMSSVDDWTLIVETKTPLDLISQSKTGSREKETRLLLPPGRHEVEVRPQFSERYALCLSPANDPFGSIEIKHSFIGEVGASSGRFLWSKNKLWLPPTRTLPSYVSLLVDCVTMPMNEAIADELRTADEVEVMTGLEHVDHVRTVLSSFPKLRSRITVASAGFGENKTDIALIRPEEEIPSQWMGKVSCLLFNDQSEEGFRSRLAGMLARLKQDQGLAEKAVESLWTTSEANCQLEGRSASYGVAWTTSSQSEQKGRVSLLRTLATETETVKADVHRYAAQPFNADVFKSLAKGH